MEPTHNFDLSSFIIRWIVCLFLVMATYNTSGYSYYHWVIDGNGLWIIKIVFGVVLITVHSFLISYTIRSLTTFRFGLVVTIYSLVGYGLLSYELIASETPNVITMVLVIIASVFATGVSFAHISYRFTGVKHVEQM